jgi:hypothetical protein
MRECSTTVDAPSSVYILGLLSITLTWLRFISSIRPSRQGPHSSCNLTTQATMGVPVNNSDGKPDVMMVENAINDDVESNPVKAPQVYHIDGFSVLGLSAEDAEFYQAYSAVDRKKTMHKVNKCPSSRSRFRLTTISQQVDVRLIPMLASLYLLAHLDRSNIGNTKVGDIPSSQAGAAY